MEQHSDIVVKNVPYGGPQDKEQLAKELRDAIQLAINDLKLEIGELVMVDIQENTSTRAETCHAFLCFKNYWQHKRIAEQLTGMVTIRRKNPTIEVSHNRAHHGPDYYGRTWVSSTFRQFKPKTVKFENSTSSAKLQITSSAQRSTISSAPDPYDTQDEQLNRQLKEAEENLEASCIRESKLEAKLERLKAEYEKLRKVDAAKQEVIDHFTAENKRLVEENKRLVGENKQLKSAAAAFTSAVDKIKLS